MAALPLDDKYFSRPADSSAGDRKSFQSGFSEAGREPGPAAQLFLPRLFLKASTTQRLAICLQKLPGTAGWGSAKS